MDCQTSSLLTWPCYYQGKGMEELRQSLLYTTLELETTRVRAQEEINKREEQVTHFKELLNKAIQDRDDALAKCHQLLFLKQQITTQVNSGVSTIEEDDPNPNPNPNPNLNPDPTQKPNDSNNAFCSSDCEESIVSSPENDSLALPENVLRLISGNEYSLPEKGNLLEAVMKAGPLLQTLLLAGPLPEWRHPPPPLEAFQIPPVTISATNNTDQIMISASNCGVVDKKRGYLECDFDDSLSPQAKYQRVLM